MLAHPSALLYGLPYALTVLGILGAHEMGHFLACRAYGVNATWPHFLPLPLLNFGTLGAFIRIRSPIPSCRALFDIAVAGPLAGFAICVPALGYGLAMARPGTVPPGAGGYEFGESLLVQALAALRWGTHTPPPDLVVGPVFLAGWLGQLATCLNLFPVGQLDGGHLLYALSPRLHHPVSRAARWVFVVFLISLGMTTGGLLNVAPWLLWTVLLFVMGDRHPPVLDPHPIRGGRRLLLLLAVAIFVLSFTPVPFRLMGDIG